MVGNCPHVIVQGEVGLRLSMFIYVYGRRFSCACYSCRHGQKRNEEALSVCSHLLNTFSSRDRRGAECLTWGGWGGTPLRPLPPLLPLLLFPWDFIFRQHRLFCLTSVRLKLNLLMYIKGGSTEYKGSWLTIPLQLGLKRKFSFSHFHKIIP